jgi:hypothetical protein
MTPEERAARERKQKIFVVVGGLFLVAMLAFQLPKLLGGSSSPEAAATTTTEPGQLTAPISAARTVANAANGIVTPAGSSASVVKTAKLSSFSVFKPKDPFVQQVKPEMPAATPAAGGGAKGAGATGGGEKPTKFSTGGAKPQSATIVVVNGIRQVVEPGTKFPSSDPLFVLVAEKPGSKSVVVGIAGGAYSGGGRTTTLKVGKPLTLVNTATGARYKISLVSVGSGDQAGAASDATKAGG